MKGSVVFGDAGQSGTRGGAKVESLGASFSYLSAPLSRTAGLVNVSERNEKPVSISASVDASLQTGGDASSQGLKYLLGLISAWLASGGAERGVWTGSLSSQPDKAYRCCSLLLCKEAAKARGAKVTGIFTSKVAERTAEIKAQRESKRPQVVGDTQVSLPVPLYAFVCTSAVYFYLRHQLSAGFGLLFTEKCCCHR